MTNKATLSIKESIFNKLVYLCDYYKIYTLEDMLNILVVKELRVIGLSRRQEKECLK